jgi:hypothetical protein
VAEFALDVVEDGHHEAWALLGHTLIVKCARAYPADEGQRIEQVAEGVVEGLAVDSEARTNKDEGDATTTKMRRWEAQHAQARRDVEDRIGWCRRQRTRNPHACHVDGVTALLTNGEHFDDDE